MEKIVANYRVIIEKDVQTGTKKSGYVAYVPTLGIANDGFTVEESLSNVRDLIKFHLESLVYEGVQIPNPDTNDYFVTNTQITYNVPAKTQNLRVAVA